MGYIKKTNHVQEAVRDLIDAFKDKVLVEGTLTAFVNRIQELEDAFSDILTLTTTTTSTGAQLDALGIIVGEPRAGRNDLQYSTAINARIKLLQSESTVEDVIGIIEAIVGTLLIVVEDQYPAAFLVTVEDGIDPNVVDVDAMGALVASGKPAGVRMWFVWHISTNPFRFDTAGQGFDQGELATQQVF